VRHALSVSACALLGALLPHTGEFLNCWAILARCARRHILDQISDVPISSNPGLGQLCQVTSCARPVDVDKMGMTKQGNAQWAKRCAALQSHSAGFCSSSCSRAVSRVVSPRLMPTVSGSVHILSGYSLKRLKAIWQWLRQRWSLGVRPAENVDSSYSVLLGEAGSTVDMHHVARW
jgi:hypothetical protein